MATKKKAKRAGVSPRRDMGEAFERSLPSGSAVPTRSQILRIAAETGCDVRTVRRVLGGAPARSLATKTAIDAAWKEEQARA